MFAGMWCCVIRSVYLPSLMKALQPSCEKAGNHSPTDTAPHCRRFECSTTPLWESQISHLELALCAVSWSAILCSSRICLWAPAVWHLLMTFTVLLRNWSMYYLLKMSKIFVPYAQNLIESSFSSSSLSSKLWSYGSNCCCIENTDIMPFCCSL